MVYQVDVYRRDEHLEKRFKELKYAKLNPRNRQLVNHFEGWMNQKGFITPKQKEALDNIYRDAMNGKG